MNIIYHKGCPDGCCAAFIMDKFLKENGFKNPNLFPHGHNDNYILPENIEGSLAVLVDFVYSPEVMAELIEKAKYVFVLDHHQTALELLDSNHSKSIEKIITNEFAASRIVFETCYPDQPVPKYILYLDDSDTGKDEILEALKLKYFFGEKRDLSPEFFTEIDSNPDLVEKWLDEGLEIIKTVEIKAKAHYVDTDSYLLQDGNKKYNVLVVLNDMTVLNYFNDVFGEDVDIILFLRNDQKNKRIKVSARAKLPHVNLLEINIWSGLELKGHIRAAGGFIYEDIRDLRLFVKTKLFRKKVQKPQWKSLVEILKN
jgi:oligoribonuclease NrnB/cAMP/cGMP phosphodiesterase (DHH superfamily)